MTAPTDCEFVGRWRIVEADLWDRAYLDLVEAAYVDFSEDGRGEFAFGAAELQDDGTLEIDIAFHHGDEALLKAEHTSSSAAC